MTSKARIGYITTSILQNNVSGSNVEMNHLQDEGKKLLTWGLYNGYFEAWDFL